MADIKTARIAKPGQGVLGVIEGYLGGTIKDMRPKLPSGSCANCGGNCSPTHGQHPMGCVLWGPIPIQIHWHKVDGCPLRHGDECNCRLEIQDGGQR